MKRPKFIFAELTDPFDDQLIFSSCIPYSARRAAISIYSRHLRRLKNAMRSISSNILEGRTPKLTIKFL